MDIVRKDGVKVSISGDTIKIPERVVQGTKIKESVLRNVIGANHSRNMFVSRRLSSFNGVFTNEDIGIETGIGDIVNTKIGDVREAYDILANKLRGVNNNDINDVSVAVLETVDEFFGGIDNVNSRMNYYYNMDFDEHENNMISNLKGTGAAMCVERSALAQNLLQYLGFNSFYKSSGITKNGVDEVHSYNLLECNNRYYIFDTSLPNVIDGKVSPLIAEIDKETFDLLSCPIADYGISTTVSHYNPYRNVDITVTYDSNREKSIEVSALGSNNMVM